MKHERSPNKTGTTRRKKRSEKNEERRNTDRDETAEETKKTKSPVARNGSQKGNKKKQPGNGNNSSNSYANTQRFPRRQEQNETGDANPYLGPMPPPFYPYWGNGYMPPPWRQNFSGPDLAFRHDNRSSRGRNDYTRRLQDDRKAQLRLRYPQNWKVPDPDEILPEHRHFYDTERVISKGLIKPFMGTIEDYPRFQQSFFNMVHIQPGPVFDKIMAPDRLITDEQTVKLLSGLGTTGADYVSRIERLEQMYGGPNRLKNHHLRVLRNLKGLVDDSLDNLKTYAHALDNYLKNSPDTESDNLVLLQVIKGRMSRALKVEYNAYIGQERLTDDNESMSLFLRYKLTNEIEAREEDSAFGMVEPTRKGKRNKRTTDVKDTKTSQTLQMKKPLESTEDESDEDGRLVHTATKLDEKANGNRYTPKTCYCCGEEGHTIFNCEKFYVMGPNDRRQFAAEKTLCYLCLSPTHRSKDCPKREHKRCGICRGRHHFLLHPATLHDQENGTPRGRRRLGKLLDPTPVTFAVPTNRQESQHWKKKSSH